MPGPDQSKTLNRRISVYASVLCEPENFLMLSSCFLYSPSGSTKAREKTRGIQGLVALWHSGTGCLNLCLKGTL